MPTTPAIATSTLANAKADAALAEAHIGQFAADQPNTMTAIRLLYAATICAMAVTNLETAYNIVQDVRTHQSQEVSP